jgi:hypothetical protein
MAKTPKTSAHDGSVADFLAGVDDATRRADAAVLVEMMQAATGAPPRLWGASIIGFGAYRTGGAGSAEGQWPLVGFSPRKTELVLYIMPGFEREAERLRRLGKHRLGKSCLYLKRLEGIDLEVLSELIDGSVRLMRERHPVVDDRA